MAIMRATVVLKSLSGEDVDEARNVWHFETSGLITTDHMNTAFNGLSMFYRDLGGNMGHSVSRAIDAHRIEFAQVTQNTAGPRDDKVSKLLALRAFSIAQGAGVAGAFPPEVAATLSFRGDISGVPEEEPGGLVRPASRRRGRIYLGPLNGSTAEIDAKSVPRVSAAFRLKVLDTYQNVALPAWVAGAQAAVRHIVYSRASAATWPVVECSVDDAYDTVRRRGIKRSFKATRPVTQAVI